MGRRETGLAFEVAPAVGELGYGGDCRYPGMDLETACRGGSCSGLLIGICGLVTVLLLLVALGDHSGLL